MPTNEGQLVAQIQTAVKKKYPTSWIFKVVGSPYQMSGVPDLLVCVDGLLVGLEVKHQKPGESVEGAKARTTPVQHVQISRINTAGGYATTVISVTEALDFIAESLRAFLERRNET